MIGGEHPFRAQHMLDRGDLDAAQVLLAHLHARVAHVCALDLAPLAALSYADAVAATDRIERISHE